MKFNIKQYAQAKQFLIDEGLYTEEYSKRTSTTKVISDANARFMDRNYVPKPPPLRKRKSRAKKGSQKRRPTSPYHKTVSLNMQIHESLKREVPKGFLTTVVNKCSAILLMYLKQYGNSYKTFLDNNWKLVQVDDEYYEELTKKLSKKKEIENNPFLG